MTKTEVLTSMKEALNQKIVTQAEVLLLLHECGDKFPALADEVEASDDLEVDDFPLYSEADDGVWVSAWVFVAKRKEGV